MPQLSKTFEFYNPWSTSNYHTPQAIIQMPQMVDGRTALPILTIYSNPIQGAGLYFPTNTVRPVDYTASYTIEGAFKGTISMQITDFPAPGESNWTTINETAITYTGTETTGGAGISGGFSGAVSRPTRTDYVTFTGVFLNIRVRLDISRGTLQAVKLNY
jgi:hypothetical protein